MRRGLAVLGDLQPRRAARRDPLGRRRAIHGLRRDGPGCCCALRGTSSCTRARSWACPRPRCRTSCCRIPTAIAFWPDFKGRDGAARRCRGATDAPHAGFSSVEPWLPVDPRPPALARRRARRPIPTSLLASRAASCAGARSTRRCRGDIRFLDAPEPVLAFTRGEGKGEGRVLCAFNLGNGDVDFALPPDLAIEPLSGHGLAGTLHGGHVRLPPPAPSSPERAPAQPGPSTPEHPSPGRTGSFPIPRLLPQRPRRHASANAMTEPGAWRLAAGGPFALTRPAPQGPLHRLRRARARTSSQH